MEKKFKIIAGLDEAGRGSLAGPVVAAAVVLMKKFENFNPQIQKFFNNLKDSKKTSPLKRKRNCLILTKIPEIKWAIGKISEKKIDKNNILEATKLAMNKAVKNLEKKLREKIDFLILDGNFLLDLKLPQKSIIKGDEKILTCKIASIIAKVSRDKIMEKYHQKYPNYLFSKHKGYGTKIHLQKIKKHGPSAIHRKTFKPIIFYRNN